MLPASRSVPPAQSALLTRALLSSCPLPFCIWVPSPLSHNSHSAHPKLNFLSSPQNPLLLQCPKSQLMAIPSFVSQAETPGVTMDSSLAMWRPCTWRGAVWMARSNGSGFRREWEERGWEVSFSKEEQDKKKSMKWTEGWDSSFFNEGKMMVWLMLVMTQLQERSWWYRRRERPLLSAVTLSASISSSTATATGEQSKCRGEGGLGEARGGGGGGGVEARFLLRLLILFPKGHQLRIGIEEQVLKVWTERWYEKTLTVVQESRTLYKFMWFIAESSNSCYLCK